MTSPEHHHDDGQLDDELAATEGLFDSVLAQFVSAPADLEQRTEVGASSTLRDRSALWMCADLLSVGADTLRLLFEPTSERTPR